MTAPTKIDVGAASIPLVYGGTGPVIAGDGPLQPLAFIVSLWAHGELPGLVEAVALGEAAGRPGSGVVTVPPAEVTDEMRAIWRSVGGGELEDPVMIATVLARGNFVMPRRALVELLEKLAKLRADWARAPWPVPPPPPAPPVPEPLPPPQLFCQEPTDAAPNEVERFSLANAEEFAAELDADEAKATTEDELAGVLVKRPVVLLELESYGLFDDKRVADKRAYLKKWEFPTLAGYLEAAEAMRAYNRSAIRATYDQLDPAPDRLLDANVSIDWFRKRVPTPPDATPEGWLAFCEVVLFDNAPTGTGEMLSKVGQRWYRIRYRPEVHSWSVVVSASEVVR